VAKGALVVGGTIAGIQAALDLANSGVEVHLVEPSPFLGGDRGEGREAVVAPQANGVPIGEGFQVHRHALNARLLEVAKHAHVSVWTNTRIVRTGGEAGRFHVELRQQPRYVNLETCTACKDCLEVCPVTVPGTDHKAIYLIEDGQPGCAVIDKIGKAPCANTCPGGIHVQGYIALIAEGRFAEALDLIRQAIPFPGICGRICTHPCEVNCRRAEVDEAVSIRLLKRFVADWELEQPPQDSPPEELPQPRPDAKRVAVIGAGPAGVAVADSLARKGYRVTVFEALPVVGGMMAVGIPSYRLPREVIEREIGRIERMGVEIRLSAPIGPGGAHTVDDLLAQGFEAIFLGVGAHQGHRLRIPGENLKGVVTGIELLKAINLSHQTDDPRWQTKVLSYLLGGVATRVAIIGGGNTAIDVARSLKRLGVEEVRILYRRTREEMPAMPEEIEEAELEGVPIEFLVSPVRILGDSQAGTGQQGRVVALECVRMKLGEPDHSGRRRPVPIAGSEFTLEVDMVVPAIGQSPDLSILGDEHNFAITREGTFNIDRVSYMTNRPGVFAAGDAITQPVSVIDAIGSAKQAAAGIDAYLRGVQVSEVHVSDREVPIAQRELLPEEMAPKPRHRSPTIPMDRRLHSHTEVELGFDAETAMAEAQRCLQCGPCSECLACEAVCEPKAILHDQQERFEHLEVGAIIASQPARGLGGAGKNGQEGIYTVAADDPLAGSAAAARVMMELFRERVPRARTTAKGTEPPPITPVPGVPVGSPRHDPTRIGVFVCNCNGQISDIVDTAAVQAQAGSRQGVVYTQVLEQSCSPEAADSIYQAVADQNLNRVVLAACSCCSVDQVCYSCTYQRVRCKDNLLGRHFDRGNPLFEFVNIREQCAWAHDDDPAGATAAAIAMVSAAIAKTRLSVVRPRASLPLEKTALILGNGPAATICQGALSAQRIQALRLRAIPGQIRQTPSHFTVVHDGSRLWKGSALILAPRNDAEREQINRAFDTPSRRPRTDYEWGCADTHRPGVFICEPSVDPMIAGMAAAARAAAWLGKEDQREVPGMVTARVDPDRCRGCGDCEEICEFGAIQLQPTGASRDDPDAVQVVAWIDPAICRGGGICAARCPAGAIITGHPTSAQIEAMLEAILA
jgi:NADPH-dependent glutamate synthase beta subunit-like oxidoreductase/NAD-dependent dihydropyrimidine dehydrogenase PreA subunit